MPNPSLQVIPCTMFVKLGRRMFCKGQVRKVMNSLHTSLVEQARDS